MQQIVSKLLSFLVTLMLLPMKSFKNFDNLDIKKVNDNGLFWKTVFLLFSNKFSRNDKMNLTDRNEIVSTDS